MQPFNHLLLDVWREACKHIEIGESVALGSPVLFRGLPVDLVLVRRIDRGRGIVETVATGVCRPGPAPEHARTECTADQMAALVAWCRRGEVLQIAPDQSKSGVLAGMLPDDLKGDVLVGALNAAEGPTGLVVLVSRRPGRFKDKHLEMVQMLVEPFTIWLENDRRLRELRSQREAAEADRQSLLRRLGRNDLSEAVVGSDTGLKPVMERVDLVTKTDVPVLILGETGSGKEVVARAIHSRSRRASGPFLRVNCGAMAPELVDSELFGHERGSFTGAVGQRKGWFERADGGTLFLDECGELPLAVQVRLLRILQDGTFERVGGEQQLHVDVRIVAATHRDLEHMVRQGGFREDLWYRLAVFPIRLPPLRDRLEDIPEMAAHFALRSAKKLGFAGCLPSIDDIQLLASYDWPGNVRELAAVIERAAILGEGKRLEMATALGAVEPRVAKLPLAAAITVASAESLPQTFLTLDQAMARDIEAALIQTKGRVEGPAGAARLLDINPHTLRARMRNLGVDWQRFRGASQTPTVASRS